MTLTIASWNINSVRLRMPIVKRFAEAARPDILCLQETKVMDEAFPVVDALQHVESVQKLLSKATPAVLVRRAGTIEGIVTRSDMLAYLMSR